LKKKQENQKKKALIIQTGNFVVKTEQLWKTLVIKSKKLYACDLIKGHDDDYVKPDNIPGEEFDLVIWIDAALDFKEKVVTDRLNGLKAEKKLIILLYFSNDTTQPHLKPQKYQTYKNPNIFFFSGW